MNNPKPRRWRLILGATDGRGSERPKLALAQSDGSARDLAQPTGGGGLHGSPAPATIDAARSKIDDWRTALHECGHVTAGRLMGEEVGGCTIVAGPDFGGLTWGPRGNSARLSSVEEKPDLCKQLAGVMPGRGEPRSAVAEIFAHVHVRVVDLMSGTAAEILLHPDCVPWVAHSDIRQARALASLICSSEAAIDAYLAFGLAEAKALIDANRHIVLALALALVERRTLDGTEIDAIISKAVAEMDLAGEKARQRKWHAVEANAERLAINQTGMRRGASRSERIDSAVAVVRDGANLRQACKIVGLRRASAMSRAAAINAAWHGSETRRCRSGEQPFPIRSSSCHRANSAS